MISVKATWVWGLINECIFLFTDRWAYDLGGSYKRKVTVFPHRKQELYEVTDNLRTQPTLSTVSSNLISQPFD